MITNMNFLLQALPWLTVIGLLGFAFLYAVNRLRSLNLELVHGRNDNIRLDREHGILQERLNAMEKEKDREQEKAGKQISDLTTERNELQRENGAFNDELTQLKVDFAALSTTSKRIEDLTEERDKARQLLDEIRTAKGTLEKDLATMQTESKERLEAADEKIKLLEQAEKKLATEFENLANRIFEEKHKKFSEVSKTNIETLLSPMRQQLTDFRKKVEDVYDTENKERASLLTEIKLLKVLNERISAEALNLTRALKGDSKLRGNWGEMQLERLLEESGLVKGREYEVQVSLKDEEGKRWQPDVVVHLPEKKDVVIDSKVSLVAYEQYYAAEDDAERQRQLRAHIASLRTHFNGLSAKKYDELTGVNSLDLVIMFVPIEPALLLAFEHEPNLFTEAFNRRILLVSPSTIMATLQIIYNIWRYEYQNRNALEIATEAGKLHDQFVSFVDALEQVGTQIRKAADSYETAHKRLTSGRGNLVGRTLKLEKLGAKAKKNIPGNLIEAAAQDDADLDIALLSEEESVEENIPA
ncbi:MAG: DNA recombination protein RmuC [Proteobacteria bacterium]|nr:DNA recombination protein RmuC [Pseudomonadota bacterium]MCG2749191.1 DNA recombination protein RmuC [Desulfobulbaceae bacterium]